MLQFRNIIARGKNKQKPLNRRWLRKKLQVKVKIFYDAIMD